MTALAELIAPASREDEPQWMSEARAAQAERFRTAGIPHEGLENWKYTSLRALQSREFAAPSPDHALAPQDLADFAIPGETWRVVLVDGVFSPRMSFLDGLPDGLRIGALGDSDVEQLEFFREFLTRDFDRADESLAALASADARDGLVLVAESGVQVEKPIYVLHLSVQADSARVANCRNLIELGEGASLAIFERFSALGDADNLTNVLSQVRLGRGSTLRQIRLQQAADSGCLVTRQETDLAADSRLDYYGFDLGGRLVRHDLICRLHESGAHAGLSGVYALEGRRHVDNHTRIDHIAPHTTSDEFFKGVLDGRCRGVFNGKVVVHPGADKTDAAQTNNNLVLSEHAEIDTKPELEIYADDVKCSHGATVGQLDERQLFYLRTRGIPLDEAKLLLTYAFCREVVDRIDDEELAAFLTEQVVAHLPRQEALARISHKADADEEING